MQNLRVKKTYVAIACISGLIFYLELALIRFLPAHILYLGFFSNFVLLAAFLGIGLGFLLARFKHNLFLFFPLTLFLVTLSAKVFSTGLNLVSNEVIFFRDQADVQSVALPAGLVLPIVFIVVALVFASLSQLLSKLFIETHNSLKAYVFDIVGSLAGIILFYITSFLGVPPFVWFSLVAIFYLLFVVYKQRYVLIIVVFLLATIFLSLDTSEGMTFWSPYQRISVVDQGNDTWNVLTNNIHHQFFSKLAQAQSYLRRFIIISSKTPLNNVLIIGSGTGQDVNAALYAGAKHIDAVEIDPQILKIGKEFHPEKPYDDERVTAINTDGRNYLHNTSNTYDVIVLALTDSLVLDSGFNQVRLESYLFTQQAFRDARDHLNKGGVLVLYNDYRTEWLVDRIGAMIGTVFQKPPEVVNLGAPALRMFISPPKQDFYADKAISKELPSDNWPFLYLKDRAVPAYYTSILVVILAIALLAVAGAGYLTGALDKLRYKRLAVFFLLGAAFSLIETKSIAQLNLLFGATWVVNGFAFIGILLAVLAASLVTLRRAKLPSYVFIIMLFVALAIQFLVPIEWILNLPVAERFITAILYFFLPIFFANLIFARLFKESKAPDLDFASNILGLVAGGVTEYAALIYGYNSLAIIAGAFYLIAILLLLRSRKTLAS